MVTTADFLGPSRTADYVPQIYGSTQNWYQKAPLFTYNTAVQMLSDSRVNFGLWLIKGPVISLSRFFVDCQDESVKLYLMKNASRFWRGSAVRALKAIEWGYSASEALYRRGDDGMIYFNTLKDLHPLDCKALTLDGKLIGCRVRNVPNRRIVTLSGPRVLWHVHSRELHPWYGRSRLYGAYLPWLEYWTDGGCRDSRRLYFHKYAFDGGVMYYPEGFANLSNQDGSIAQVISNKDIAREIMEKKKTGGTMAIPNKYDVTSGQRQWEYIGPTMTPPPQGVQDYAETLKDDIWEGMGIPPEIARAEGTGAYAGRTIPLRAFYSILQEIVDWLIRDFSEQILKPLVRFNFGYNPEFEIVPFPLTKELENLEPNQSGADSAPPVSGQNPSGAQPALAAPDVPSPITV